jgi:hypothetical protein
MKGSFLVPFLRGSLQFALISCVGLQTLRGLSVLCCYRLYTGAKVMASSTMLYEAGYNPLLVCVDHDMQRDG